MRVAKAKIVYENDLVRYFNKGVEFIPTGEQRLMDELFNIYVKIPIKYRAVLDTVEYKSEMELNEKIACLITQYGGYIKMKDLIIETI